MSIGADLGYVLCGRRRIRLRVICGGQRLSLARQSPTSQEGFHHGGHRGHGGEAQKKPCVNQHENPTRAVLFSVVSVRSVVSSSWPLPQKDVKNEDRSDYVYENKGEHDKLSSEKEGFLQENTTIAR